MDKSVDTIRRLAPMEADDGYGYSHPLRPQYHYAPKQGFIADTTGLIYYKGKYHLFNMFDPWAMERREHKSWGHAESYDLLYWKQLPPVLDTLIDNRPGSGCAVVDHENCSGLRRGFHKPLFIYYTDYVRGTCILYSNDGGDSWTRFKGNPVLPIGYGVPVESPDPLKPDLARDPLVFLYKPTQTWCMIRYEGKGFTFYTSGNLLEWAYASRLEGFYECPDFFELPVDGRGDEKKWVLVDGNGHYFIGSFDGLRFHPETEELKVEYGDLYATQTWKETCDFDGLVQIAWLRYPEKPELLWRGQTSIPCVLRLQRFADGIRLCRQPIAGIKNLYVDTEIKKGFSLVPGEGKGVMLQGDLVDLYMEAQLEAGGCLNMDIRGGQLRYDGDTLTFNGKKAPLPLEDGRVSLRILVDRCSVEVFGNGGRASISTTFFPEENNTRSCLYCTGGKAYMDYYEQHRLESIWLENEVINGNCKMLQDLAQTL